MLNGTFMSFYLLPKIRDHCEKEYRNILSARSMGNYGEKAISDTAGSLHM